MENTNQPTDFQEFPKIARLSRECWITEKIDGTNGQICITEDGQMLVGSRSRWITPEQDNYGFARWAANHREELMTLGVGRHFGEWWGSGCQRGYGLPKGEKRWSLFNVSRWTADPRIPACCHLVPVLYRGIFTTDACEAAIADLRTNGSKASPGFMKPEGIICFHVAANMGFKKTLEKDESLKSKQALNESAIDPHGSAVACVGCGCMGNCSCGHAPLDSDHCCTLDTSDICPCCRATKPHLRRTATHERSRP